MPNNQFVRLDILVVLFLITPTIKKMKCLKILSFILCLLANSIEAQDLVFEYLEAGEVTGMCASNSDSTMNVQCYAVKYTPGGTGDLTSYTMGFFSSCTSLGNPYIDSGTSSCIMSNNSSAIDACETSFATTLITLSGNSGGDPVTEGVSITVHQVCFEVPLGDTIILTKDETSGLTFSIDPEGDQPAFTDVPTFTEAEITNEFACEESTYCSVDFGSSGNKVSFMNNAMGNIVDGSSLENSFSFSQSFDVYDEINMSCISPGGEDDITFDFQIINTIDINDNGFLDELAGVSHNLKQSAEGIEASIPFNSNAESESTPGDVRGYSIEVRFENHIGIVADQLEVHLDGINTAGSAFESAALIFLDDLYNDYGSVTHHGFYGKENDLSGGCISTKAGINFEVVGNGVIAFQDTSTVDRTLPCDIGLGSDGTKNSPTINARFDTGLDSAAVIGGFRLIVFGEDIEAPSLLDDGSGTAPDDGIAANSQTTTNSLLQSTVKGITVKGCVFSQQVVLPLQWTSVEVEQVGDENVLEWKTSNEVNTDYFEIEWSKNGKDFIVLGNEASKNTIGNHTYNWRHKNSEHNWNYYRIKQVDLDGRYYYSEIVYIEVVRNQSFNVYPNPTSDLLIMEGISSGQSLTIQIYNTSGQLVMIKEEVEREIDVFALREGLYHLVAITEKNRKSANFIKKSIR